jgi:hypothetical protein
MCRNYEQPFISYQPLPNSLGVGNLRINTHVCSHVHTFLKIAHDLCDTSLEVMPSASMLGLSKPREKRGSRCIKILSIGNGWHARHGSRGYSGHCSAWRDGAKDKVQDWTEKRKNLMWRRGVNLREIHQLCLHEAGSP